MQIDKQTLKDLEIFKTSDGGMSLFEILDKTVTSGGRYRLREKFENPLNDIKQIKEVQETVSLIAGQLERWTFPFSETMMKSLENYVSSNIDPIKPGSRAQLLFQSLGYYLTDKSIYSYLKESIIEVAVYLNQLTRTLQINSTSLNHGIIQFIINDVKSLFEEPVFRKLSEKTFANQNLSFTEVYYFDGLLRGKNKNRLKKTIQIAYELDALISMAKAKVEFGLNFPEIDVENITRFEATGLYHLALRNPVPYNISILNENNFLFLTGPNMAGKTTLLKSVGIAVYLAHIGMAVPAQQMKVQFFDRLISSLTVSDNIVNGYSYFFSEVRRVKDVAEALSRKEKVFALFDELFKGTNVKDAYTASALIISGLVKWKHSLFILSSHLAELETDINKYPGIGYYYFESDVKDGVPAFTYRLKAGVSNTRLGLVIIENEKIMELLNGKENDNN
jgi:DNA mismatch repair ATPase MutS